MQEHGREWLPNGATPEPLRDKAERPKELKYMGDSFRRFDEYRGQNELHGHIGRHQKAGNGCAAAVRVLYVSAGHAVGSPVTDTQSERPRRTLFFALNSAGPRQNTTTDRMPAQGNNESAIHTLEQGDFEHAWDRYGKLVELFPEDPEYACGLYAAGYWKNRLSAIAEEAQGRARGAYLFREWDRFQKMAEEKEFESCLAYRAAMQWVLGNAAAELRGAFHAESGRSVDPSLLVDLSTCLIRIEDYANAVDILRYTTRLHPGNARILFLLGEALCSSGAEGDKERGLACYRDAFLLDPSVTDPTLIASETAASVFRDLFSEAGQDLERTLLWFPARLSAASFRFQVRSIPEKDTQAWSDEISRLQASLKQVVEKFRDRVRARIAFLLLEILRCAHSIKDHGSIEAGEEMLRNLAPDVYAAYKDARK